MLQGKRIAVVIPCYRVAGRIGAVVGAIPAFVDHVVLVDDGSGDEFGDAVQALDRGRVVVLRHATNRGVGCAVVSGFARAIELGADVVAKMDGDGQMDPADLPKLLLPIVQRRADFTKGNRFVHRRHLHGMPMVRLIGNLGLSFLAKAASGYWHIFDPTNGYLALRREVIAELDLARLSRRYFFETSLLIETYLTGAVVKDVSLPSRYGDEPSSLSVGRSLVQFPFLLLKGCARRVLLRYFVRDFTPVALFLITGTLLMVFGGSFGAWRWFQNYGSGVPTAAGTVVLAVLPLFVGFQLILQAIVMDIGNVPRESPWPEAAGLAADGQRGVGEFGGRAGESPFLHSRT